MMVRTPPTGRKRRAEPSVDDLCSPVSDRRLVVYNDPLPVATQEPGYQHDGMVCTYQCRQMVKSEFMVALRTAENQVLEYQSKFEAINNDLCRSENERQKFHGRLLLLEQNLAASKGREHALQERLIKEINGSQKQYQEQATRSSELEVRLKKEVDLRRTAEALAVAAKEKAEDAEQKVEHLSEILEREKRNFMKELSEAENEAKMSSSRLNIELERMKLKADCAMEESVVLRKQMEDFKERLNACLLQRNKLEHKLDDLMARSPHVAPSEDRSLVKHLQEELRNYEADVQEARKLKASHADVELLKEKLLEEKVRRERAEAELHKLQEAELNSSKLADELKTLKSLVNEIPGVSSLEEVPKQLAALQKETLLNMKNIGEITEHLKQLEVALDLANQGKQEAETETALARKEIDELILEAKQLKQMLKTVSAERDRLRKDLSTSNKRKGGEMESEMVDESFAKILETSLVEKENFIRELENDLREHSKIISNQHGELRSLTEKLNVETRRTKSLEREGDRLRSEIALLESKIGHGAYSSANTKVLRMVNTLAVDNEAKHTIEALRAELHKAQEKLQAVEELKGQSVAGHLIDANISEKLAQLKGQIATLEKREERYKTVFADKISVFRRACCSLFGYKIIMDEQQRPNGIPVTRFTLQSIYAQTDDEKLEFEYESGNINILVNDYTSQPEISHQVEIFIQKMNAIPAFTANLTMESFNKRTLS